MDGQTHDDGIYHSSIASRSKNLIMLAQVTAKKSGSFVWDTVVYNYILSQKNLSTF